MRCPQDGRVSLDRKRACGLCSQCSTTGARCSGRGLPGASPGAARTLFQVKRSPSLKARVLSQLSPRMVRLPRPKETSGSHSPSSCQPALPKADQAWMKRFVFRSWCTCRQATPVSSWPARGCVSGTGVDAGLQPAEGLHACGALQRRLPSLVYLGTHRTWPRQGHTSWLDVAWLGRADGRCTALLGGNAHVGAARSGASCPAGAGGAVQRRCSSKPEGVSGRVRARHAPRAPPGRGRGSPLPRPRSPASACTRARRRAWAARPTWGLHPAQLASQQAAEAVHSVSAGTPLPA